MLVLRTQTRYMNLVYKFADKKIYDFCSCWAVCTYQINSSHISVISPLLLCTLHAKTIFQFSFREFYSSCPHSTPPTLELEFSICDHN